MWDDFPSRLAGSEAIRICGVNLARLLTINKPGLHPIRLSQADFLLIW